ncbi:hypothetical protein C9374_005520 [Naegleria lovaniensis]|uniref:Uncharacterized protein n=1 Tax=Naegleria lovaniensis TaxID=51637 RepID=A0AA88GQI8_NAELO|nr:uncharacterized protein C9374_005520 [Naegleria lovaniensis]KAG2382318.1 hypothetical protein C9374_005520 [Naegleria lovaniensis]
MKQALHLDDTTEEETHQGLLRRVRKHFQHNHSNLSLLSLTCICILVLFEVMCLLSAMIFLTNRNMFFLTKQHNNIEQPKQESSNAQSYQPPPLPLYQEIPQHQSPSTQPFPVAPPKPLSHVQIEECVRMEQAEMLYLFINYSDHPPVLGQRYLEMETAWPKFYPSTVNVNVNNASNFRTVQSPHEQDSGSSSYSFLPSSTSLSTPNIPSKEYETMSESKNSVPSNQVKETEFRTYFEQHKIIFQFMSFQSPLNEDLDAWKNSMNELNFVMNADKYDERNMKNEHHLPIWLRVFQRTQPLHQVLQAICHVHNINESILIVTIDGNGFFDVLQELTKVQCVKMRIYFHAFHTNLKTLLNSYEPNLFDVGMLFKKSVKLLTHAMYGLYLAFVKYQYPYVITLEDDIQPLPDFYNYHRSLYTLTLEDSPQNPYYTVSAYAHGRYHHCRYISGSLFSEKLFSKHEEQEFENQQRQIKESTKTIQCRMQDTDQLVLEQYHAIWGSGIPRRVFQRLWQVWISATVLKKHSQYFLGVLLRDLRQPHERTITPCSNRITRLANTGENGEDDNNERRYWTLSAAPCTKYQNESSVKFWKYSQRKYQILNE